jgi:hypothetical protein
MGKIELHNLPGISRIMVGNTTAVIYYIEDRPATRLSADDYQKLVALLSSFLVPREHNKEFLTIESYNKAVDGLEEVTQEIGGVNE